jgi:hypothetical protein
METLWNILTRWKKPKMLKEGTDYTFVNSDNGNVTGVYMLQGKYKGVLYHYHKARIVEEGALARLQFGFTIIDPGTHDPDELTNDQEFSTIMGDILQTILLAKIENEKTGNNDSQEFILQ